MQFVADLKYQDRSYVNSPVVDEDDDVLPGKDGYTAKFSVEQEFEKAWAAPVTLFAGIRYDDYDSDNAIYEYDRVQVFAGLEVRLGD